MLVHRGLRSRLAWRSLSRFTCPPLHAAPILLFLFLLPASLPSASRHYTSSSRHGPFPITGNFSNPIVILTTSNWMYRALLHNFACTLHRLPGSPRPVVHALDSLTHAFAHEVGLTAALACNATNRTAARPGAFEPVGPLSFASITKTKLVAARDALRAGLAILLSDADIFWCVDARAVLSSILQSDDYNDADVLIQAEAGYRSLNSGFYFARANARSVALFDALVENAGMGNHDQDVVNAVFCKATHGGRVVRERYGPGGRVPFSCRSHGATIRLLDAEQFPSGAQPVHASTLVSRVMGRTDVPIFSLPRDELERRCRRGEFVVVHNNFIRADKKVARFVVKGMWFLKGKGSSARCTSKAAPSSKRAVRTCGVFC